MRIDEAIKFAEHAQTMTDIPEVKEFYSMVENGGKQMSEIKNPFETIENYNIKHHAKICKEMNDLYERKNHDYGDSFHCSFEEEGWATVRIKLSDKLNRFKTLTKGKEQLVNDESIRDTLIDMANYSVMAISELDRIAFEKNAENKMEVEEQ